MRFLGVTWAGDVLGARGRLLRAKEYNPLGYAWINWKIFEENAKYPIAPINTDDPLPIALAERAGEMAELFPPMVTEPR